MLKKTLKKYIKILSLLIEYVKIKFFDDNKLIFLFRKKLHILEKQQFIQENISLIDTMLNRRFYFEAKRKRLLSEDEIEWANRILFGMNQKNIKNKIAEDNTLINIIRKRRSIRRFNNKKISHQTFEKLVDAARWAPSSCNRQPWHLIIIDKKEFIEKLSFFRKQNFIQNAPYSILVLQNKKCYSKEPLTLGLDAGVAIQNILLMAECLGLSTCCVNLTDHNLTDKSRREIKRLLNIPEYFELIAIIPIGFSDFNFPAPGRKNLNEIINYNSFKASKF